MIVVPFPSGPLQTNAYIVACSLTRQCAIVDPAPQSASTLIHYISQHQLHPTKILLTHTHWDHIADVAKMIDEYAIPVSVHADDAPNLEKPGSDGLPNFFPLKGIKPDVLLHGGEIIDVGQLHFEVINTPGHTPGGVCFYEKQQGVLLSGDTLFKGTIGNISFSTGEADRMWKSLDRLAKLPPETLVYPGHGPNTTIGTENWLPRAKQIFGS